MWESPIYKFKTEIDGKKKDILIDVTGSAPNFKVPGTQLAGTFDVLLKDLDPKKTKILDFGGAKLRNTVYLLKKGFTVYACEFEDLFKRSKQANDFYEECRSFKNFKKLVFPKDFIEYEHEFDVILLINVLNIMPVPIERLCVLALCRERMKEDGRLLWYTQHGGYSEDNAVTKLFDGLVTGKGRNYNMFYRDFSRKEIHDMLKSTGFSYNKDFKFPSSGSNQAYVFNADGDILVDKTLGLTEMLKKKRGPKLKSIERTSRWDKDGDGVSEKVAYTTAIPQKATKLKGVDILATYLKELDKIKPGKRSASKYHQLIFNILKSLFEDRLKKPQKEEVIADGIKRVDITFKNPRTEGFFAELAEGYNLTCPNIFIECKNYSGELGTPEFDQIQGRLNNVRGQFGIIICRKVSNAQKIKDRQNDAIKKYEYVLVLTDTDIKKLVNFKLQENEEAIDDYLDNLFKKIV